MKTETYKYNNPDEFFRKLGELWSLKRHKTESTADPITKVYIIKATPIHTEVR